MDSGVVIIELRQMLCLDIGCLPIECPCDNDVQPKGVNRRLLVGSWYLAGWSWRMADEDAIFFIVYLTVKRL